LKTIASGTAFKRKRPVRAIEALPFSTHASNKQTTTHASTSTTCGGFRNTKPSVKDAMANKSGFGLRSARALLSTKPPRTPAAIIATSGTGSNVLTSR